ncbi:MAG: Ig-like domain-containing protein, partial [Bacteroidales bacterium]|nr:Ig-like domain-containing protein [Bacteroidales bacterium]
MLFAQLKETLYVPKGSVGDVIVYPTIYNTTKELGFWDNDHFTYTSIGTEVTFAKSELALKAGAAATANAATTNSTGTVTYESSNTSVATVDASGNVTPIAEGTATITASVAATGKYLAGSATCTV